MTAPRRRWFSFSLRTMFVAILVLSLPLGYFGWQLQVVRERRAVLEEIRRLDPYNFEFFVHDINRRQESRSGMRSGVKDYDRSRIPLVRRLLGDEPYVELLLPPSLNAQ